MYPTLGVSRRSLLIWLVLLFVPALDAVRRLTYTRGFKNFEQRVVFSLYGSVVPWIILQIISCWKDGFQKPRNVRDAVRIVVVGLSLYGTFLLVTLQWRAIGVFGVLFQMVLTPMITTILGLESFSWTTIVGVLLVGLGFLAQQFGSGRPLGSVTQESEPQIVLILCISALNGFLSAVANAILKPLSAFYPIFTLTAWICLVIVCGATVAVIVSLPFNWDDLARVWLPRFGEEGDFVLLLAATGGSSLVMLLLNTFCFRYFPVTVVIASALGFEPIFELPYLLIDEKSTVRSWQYAAAVALVIGAVGLLLCKSYIRPPPRESLYPWRLFLNDLILDKRLLPQYESIPVNGEQEGHVEVSRLSGRSGSRLSGSSSYAPANLMRYNSYNDYPDL